LRGNEKLYYYYKAVQLAYFTNTGYKFNVIPLNQAVVFVNIIIKERRWHHLYKMEIINAFYVLISNKFFNPNSDLITSTSILAFSFFSIWTLISVLKVVITQVNLFALAIIIVFPAMLINIKYETRYTFIVTGIILTGMLFFNTNDLLITLFLICHSIVYYLALEIYFFAINKRNLIKIINKYNTQSIKSQLPFEFGII
jgi:hypothetical protein